MAERDAHGAEEVFGRDAVGIPLRDGVFRVAQLVGFPVGEGPLLVVPLHVELAFGFHAIDGLVVEHSAIVLEEGAVFPAHVDQHGGEAVGAAAAFAVVASPVPQFGFGAPRVAVAAAAGVAGIDGAEAAGDGAGVVVEPVAVAEAHGVVGVGVDPVGLCVVGHGTVEEDGGDAGRQGIALRHFHVAYVQPLVVAGGDGKSRAEQGAIFGCMLHRDVFLNWGFSVSCPAAGSVGGSESVSAAFVPRCPYGAVRSASPYSAASTRVLCGKYNPAFRTPSARFPRQDARRRARHFIVRGMFVNHSYFCKAVKTASGGGRLHFVCRRAVPRPFLIPRARCAGCRS